MSEKQTMNQVLTVPVSVLSGGEGEARPVRFFWRHGRKGVVALDSLAIHHFDRQGIITVLTLNLQPVATL